MAANCAQLRQSLAHLQSQLNVLTNKQQQQQPEEPPKPEKAKKSKSKKSKKQEAPKESESDSNAKESANESANEEKVTTVEAMADEAIANEDADDKETVADTTETTVDKTETVEDKAKLPDNPEAVVDNDIEEIGVKDVITDDKTLESLIQAINSANINLSDLEVIGDDKIDLDDILDIDSLTKSTDTASGDASEISNDTSNEQSPKNEPKPVDVIEEITESVKVILVTDRLGDDAKVVEFTEEIINGPKGPKIVELSDEIANSPKIIELSDDDIPKDALLSESLNIGVPKEVKDAANTEIKAKAQSTAQVTDA